MRFMTIIITVALLLNISVSASGDTPKELCNNIIASIAPYVIENENATITRGDCVATIMKLIGVDKDASETYANMDFDQPVFLDITHDDDNFGYIILAKFSNIALGIKTPFDRDINKFEADRNVTLKECLTFMLRCLISNELVSWDNIMEDSIKLGLLHESEINSCVGELPMSTNQFYTLLFRMLNKNRYLYWETKEPISGLAKFVQVDYTNSISYIDWIRSKVGMTDCVKTSNLN